MIPLSCPNKECGYVWNYNGKASVYTSCPRCLWRVKVKKCNRCGRAADTEYEKPYLCEECARDIYEGG